MIFFRDQHGLITLSSKQQSGFVKWVRPSDFLNDPTMIIAVSCFPIRQTCVTDCSFVASMAVAAQYERRFKKRLITKCVRCTLLLVPNLALPLLLSTKHSYFKSEDV